MKKEQAEQIVNEYMKPVYAFVMKRVSSEQDAQDLAQDICLKLYRSLCQKEVGEVQAYVWAVARHSLANYYRGKQMSCRNVSLEEWEFDWENGEKSALDQMILLEDMDRIRREIAYLSKTQRQVVIQYYYEEKKQSEIAECLGIPLGTVKWHLNAAKTELKKGMEKMRDRSNLVFHPIEFGRVGLSGGTGTMGAASNFFRSALSQNIVYSICKEPLTVEEIADAIGVSPVYVESELDFLEEYSLVRRNKRRYEANIIVEEANEEWIQAHRQLYEKAAEKMACRLYDRISAGGYLDSSDITEPDQDKNMMMWSLVFYLLAWAKGSSFQEKITFDEVAELRADGGKNIIMASVKNDAGEKYMEETGMSKFCGPCWNGNDDMILWVIDGDWTETRVTEHYGGPGFARHMSLLKRFVKGDVLSEDEYAFMLQNHYIRRGKDSFELGFVVLKDGEVRKQLLELAQQVKDEVMPEIMESLEAYKKEIMSSELLAKPVRRQQEFLLQHMFNSDGWLLLYAKDALVKSGRLKPVEGEKRHAVSEMLIIN